MFIILWNKCSIFKHTKTTKRGIVMEKDYNGKQMKKIFGTLSFSVVAKTELEDYEFFSLMSDDSLEAKVVLEAPDGQVYEVDILDIVANWSNWEDI